MKGEEGFGARLLSIHNIRYLIRMMERAREAIKNDDFLSFASKELSVYKDERGC